MPLGKRLILPTLDYAPVKHDGTADDDILDSVSAAKMAGLMVQLGKLAEYATEIFKDIQTDLELSFKRVRALNSRVVAATPSVLQSFATLAKFRLVKRPDPPLTQANFTVETRDPANKNRYLAARPKPQFEQFSVFTKGEDVGKKFSNPQYFFEMWLQAEQTRLDEAAQRKKNRGDKKKKKVNPTKEAQKTDVAKVAMKVYDPTGLGLAVEAPVQQRKASLKRGSANNIQSQDGDSEYSSQPQNPPTSPPRGSAMYQAPPIASTSPPRQPSVVYTAPPPMSLSPPPPPVFGAGSTHMAPPIPSAPAIPMAPAVPMAPAIPSAPSIPAAPDSGDGDSIAPVPTYEEEESTPQPSAFALQLTQVKLRQAAPVAPKPVDQKSNLLAQIRDKKNIQLRKVEVQKREVPASGPIANLSVAAIMARRAAIEGDSDEEEEDTEWE